MLIIVVTISNFYKTDSFKSQLTNRPTIFLVKIGCSNTWIRYLKYKFVEMVVKFNVP